MPWMLVFVFASVSNVSNVATPVTVPMATEKLCKEAVIKLKDAYKQMQSVNYVVLGECLQVR
jgi:hypothetical protein